MKNKKVRESSMLARFAVDETLLEPLVIRKVLLENDLQDSLVDARLDVGLASCESIFRFVIESKSGSTPEVIQSAIRSAKRAASRSEWPMIQVPYLSPSQIEILESEQVSGVDLCGNGIVIVPGRLLVVRTGQPNLYPDSRPLNNPYRGRSAMVARTLLSQPTWKSLTELAVTIEKGGGKLSLPQVSKAVQALKEELIVSKKDGMIQLIDASQLLDKLGQEWSPPRREGRTTLRLQNKDWANALSANRSLRWAVTGESSVTRYAMLSQSGPLRMAVTDVLLARKLLDGIDEPIPSFADVELIETDSAGFYFDNEIDPGGVRWASQLQTWIELRAGDARQQEAARDIRAQLLKRIEK